MLTSECFSLAWHWKGTMFHLKISLKIKFQSTQYNTIVSDIIHSLTIWGLQNIGWISELPLIVFFFQKMFIHPPPPPPHRRLFGLRFLSRECFAVELAYISLRKLTSLGFQVPFKLHLFSKFGVGIKWETFCFVWTEKSEKVVLVEKSIGLSVVSILVIEIAWLSCFVTGL